MQNHRGEQKEGQVCDDMRPQALALTSSAIRPNSLARSPYAKCKPAAQQKHRTEQRPENCVDLFSVHQKSLRTGECVRSGLTPNIPIRVGIALRPFRSVTAAMRITQLIFSRMLQPAKPD